MNKTIKKISLSTVLLTFTISVYATNNQQWYTIALNNSITTLRTIYSSIRNNTFVKKHENTILAGATLTAGIGTCAYIGWRCIKKTTKKQCLTKYSDEDKAMIAELLVKGTMLKTHDDWNRQHPITSTQTTLTPEAIIARVNLQACRNRFEALKQRVGKYCSL